MTTAISATTSSSLVPQQRRTRRGRLSQIPVLELNRHNFDACWPYLLISVKNASWIAIDLELSGLGERQGLSAKSVDERYAAIRDAARSRSILSVGIAAFKLSGRSERRKRVKFQCQVFNIITLSNLPFTIEPDALQFLAEHEFDFNRLINTGVRYSPSTNEKTDPLRTLFTEILTTGVPICLHNGLVDLVFLHQHFYAPLPDLLPQFLANLTDWFNEPSALCDSKYLAEFETRTPASFLEYLFRRCQRENAQEALSGRAYISVQFDDHSKMLPAIKTGIEWHICPLFGGNAQRPVDANSELCVTFSCHGFCNRGRTCLKSHDVDLILDLEEAKRLKSLDKRKRRYSSITGAAITTVTVFEENQSTSSTADEDTSVVVVGRQENGHQTNGVSAVKHTRFSVTGCHRAGIDAFITGFSIAYFERMALLRSGRFHPDHCNRLPLSGKPTPLVIQRAMWGAHATTGSEGSKEHLEKWHIIVHRFSVTMDVDRMMREMTIAELIQIDSKLDREMEEKREELRQMVGRRYRDVLEAAVGVRKVRACGENLADQLRTLRANNSASVTDGLRSMAMRGQAMAPPLHHVAALHRIITLIGSSDSLGNVFLLLLAETIARQLAATQLPMEHGKLVRNLTDRLMRFRLEMDASLVSELGELADPVEHVACQLMAIALLKQMSMAELLEMYLECREKNSMIELKDRGSLLGLITGLRSTLQAVQILFLDGNLAGYFQAVSTVDWKPAIVQDLLANETLSFAGFIQTALRELHSRRPFAAVLHQKPAVSRDEVCRKCAETIEKTSAMGRSAVGDVAGYMETMPAIIDFLTGIDEMLRRSDWPQVVTANVSVYRLLFGEKLLERFQELIRRELTAIGDDALKQLPVIDCKPLGLWQQTNDLSLQTRTISPELNKLCADMNDRIKSVHALVTDYIRLGQEEQVGQLEQTLKNAVVAYVQRLSNVPREDVTDGDMFLRYARLCTGLCETGQALKAAVNDSETYTAVRTTLTSAIDRYQMRWIDYSCPKWVLESGIEEMIEAVKENEHWLQYAQDWEEVPVAEGGSGSSSSVWVPVQMSAGLLALLRRVAVVQAHYGGRHRFSRAVRTHQSAVLGISMKSVYERCRPASARIAIQLLFDVRSAGILFGAAGDLETEKQRLEAAIDPFDLDLISPALRRNITRALHRTSVLFGLATASELPVSKDASSTVQCVPMVQSPARFNLLPLVAAYQDTQSMLPAGIPAKTAKVPGANKPAAGGHLSSAASEAFRSTPSLASFYDKISTSWWGN